MSFADLKKQSSLGSLTQKLVKEVEKMNTTGGGADERLWKPELDKTGNGYAVIRFLPSPDGEDIPWAKLYSHAFQGPGGWYIENSLTTTGGKDPVSDYNRELWNSGNEADKDTVRKQKRKLSYYSNIYVVKDQVNPQKLKIVKKDGYWNYDKSEFDSPSPLLEDDDALEALWKKQYSLTAVTAADQFKTYDVLEKRLKYVLGQGRPAPRRLDEELEDESEGRGSFKPDFKTRKAEEAVAAAPVASSSADEDDAYKYFQALAES